MTMWSKTAMLSGVVIAGAVSPAAHTGRGEVEMGQVHHDEMSLEDLMAGVREGYTTLALVRLDTPEYVKRAYPVPGGNGKTCPPYDFIEYRGVLERMVRISASHPSLAAGKTIAIVPANVPDLVYLAQRECVDGTSKSPIWPLFKGGAKPGPGALLLVVLTHDDTYGWREYVAGGWLAESDLGKLEKLLGAPRR
jgi:hypothetical protein